MGDFDGLVVVWFACMFGGAGCAGALATDEVPAPFAAPGLGAGTDTNASVVIKTGVPQPGHFSVCPTNLSGPLSLALHCGQRVAIGMTMSLQWGGRLRNASLFGDTYLSVAPIRGQNFIQSRALLD